MSPTLILAIGAAYVIGSIDFAVVVARMHGVDIHSVGSGNPGASNVLRSIGRFPAALVMLGDTLKGVVAAAMGMVASGVASPTIHWAFLAGLAAVVGHCYPVFHKFKGGKGVATGLGVLIFTLPLVGLIAVGLWGALVAVTKTASISSLIAMVLSIPMAIWAGVDGLALVWLVATIGLIVWRHRSNIARVVGGREQKVSN